MPFKRKFDIQFPQQNNSAVKEPFGSVMVKSQQGTEETTTPSTPTGSSKKEVKGSAATEEKKDRTDLQSKKAWELATSPFRGLFMTAFLLWMSGNTIHIFPIIITVMSIFNPLRSIFTTRAAFQQFEDSNINLTLPKLVYIFFHLIGLGIALVKCYYLGLLPNYTDWLASTPQEPLEISVLGSLQ
jgi:hypothetical protein